MSAKTTLTTTVILWVAACGSHAGNPGEETPTTPPKSSVILPDARGISLRGLGTAGAGLLDSAECSGTSALGIFGIPLGAACATTPIASKILYGSNPDRDGDGQLTCNDYVQGGSDEGLIF